MDSATESITKELFCPFCNHKYQWKNILLAHIKYSHQATLWCSECKYISKDEQSLRIHMKSIHEHHITDEISQSIGINKSDKKKKLEKFAVLFFLPTFTSFFFNFSLKLQNTFPNPGEMFFLTNHHLFVGIHL